MLAQAPRAHPVDLALAVPAEETETYTWVATLRLHRRYDAYAGTVFIIAEEY